MASGSIIPGSQAEQRGLTYWMKRVLEELEEVRLAPEADAVHDLRVALRRCRSLAAVMEEVDPDPGWPEMRKIGRKLFRQLGELRDTQVLEEWVEKLGNEKDVVRGRLLAQLNKNETAEREAALRIGVGDDGDAAVAVRVERKSGVMIIGTDNKPIPGAQAKALETCRTLGVSGGVNDAAAKQSMEMLKGYVRRHLLGS